MAHTTISATIESHISHGQLETKLNMLVVPKIFLFKCFYYIYNDMKLLAFPNTGLLLANYTLFYLKIKIIQQYYIIK